MITIYVLSKEYGEYEDYTTDILECYSNEKKAKNRARYLNKRDNKENDSCNEGGVHYFINAIELQ